MGSKSLRLRGRSSEHITNGVLIVGGLIVLAVIFAFANATAAIVTAVIATVAALVIYGSGFRAVEVAETYVQVPTGVVRKRIVPLSRVADVGVLERGFGEKSPAGWILEITDTECKRVQCLPICEPAKSSSVGESRPGKAAKEIYDWIMARQGLGGPLERHECRSELVWVLTGPMRHLSWWSPDGERITPP